MKAKEIISRAGLNYGFYIDEAKSIVRELEQDNISLSYLEEKIKNVNKIFKDLEDEILRYKRLENGS
ncbi:MAG: hypothetical protein AB7V77_05830 [Candidatus Woesearchaeota archaeon]